MGGRPRKIDRATLTMAMAMAAMADSKAVAADVAKRLGITTTTLYVYVNRFTSTATAPRKLPGKLYSMAVPIRLSPPALHPIEPRLREGDGRRCVTWNDRDAATSRGHIPGVQSSG